MIRIELNASGDECIVDIFNYADNMAKIKKEKIEENIFNGVRARARVHNVRSKCHCVVFVVPHSPHTHHRHHRARISPRTPEFTEDIDRQSHGALNRRYITYYNMILHSHPGPTSPDILIATIYI